MRIAFIVRGQLWERFETGHGEVVLRGLGLLNARYWDVGGSDGGEELLCRRRQLGDDAPSELQACSWRRGYPSVVGLREGLRRPGGLMARIPETPGEGRRAGMLFHLIVDVECWGVINETASGAQGRRGFDRKR